MAYNPNSWSSERAHLANLTLAKAPEAEITESRRRFRALRLLDHVEKWLAG